MTRATTPSGFNQPQPEQPSEVGARRRASFLEAHTVNGSLIQGKASAILVATLTDEDNQPLHGQPIHFSIEASGKDLGTVSTNRDGEASLDTGSHLADIQSMVFGAASGYVAEFKGSPNFQGSKARGKFNATL
ncbi:hypothetical protein [Kitasatospora sp. NPDC057936]|uniref:hypothetical protein n=1 Tax=Kitasatospora sp. NPDC057936 TaxID=3346283 RepID=UPI0036D76A0B